MNKKQIIELLGGIFIAIIFVSSYLSRTDYNNFNTTTTAAINATTVYGVGVTNAIIVGYYPGISATVFCKNSSLGNATLSFLSNTLTGLENNNSISNFEQVNNKMLISAGTMNSSTVYEYTSSRLNSTALNCTSFSGAATISLPSSLNVNVNVPGQASQKATLQIPPNQRNYSINLNYTNTITTKVAVRVSALIYQNGTISQMTVVRT